MHKVHPLCMRLPTTDLPTPGNPFLQNGGEQGFKRGVTKMYTEAVDKGPRKGLQQQSERGFNKGLKNERSLHQLNMHAIAFAVWPEQRRQVLQML